MNGLWFIWHFSDRNEKMIVKAVHDNLGKTKDMYIIRKHQGPDSI